VKIPTLIIGYNRKDLLERQVNNCIKLERPFFIAIDGPKNGEDRLALDTQKYILDLTRKSPSLLISALIRKENLGCRLGVNSAITWAFSMAESLIILEDDVDVDERFFSFMDYAIKNYREDKSIFLVNGWSPLTQFDFSERSLPGTFRSAFLFASGWATWSNRWHLIDTELKSYRPNKNISKLPTVEERKFGHFLTRIIRFKLDQCLLGLDTWDYQVLYSMWREGAYSITPLIRLSGNLGFDSRATHTKSAPSNVELILWSLPDCLPGTQESEIWRYKELDLNDSRELDHLIGKKIFNVYSGSSLKKIVMQYLRLLWARFLV